MADSSISALFEAQAAKTPDAVAIRFGDCEVRRGALEERTNRCAHLLRGLGVGPGTLVGLCGARSPELIAGLLGILKAGAGYVAIDPAHPAARIRLILDDALVRLILVAGVNPREHTWLARYRTLDISRLPSDPAVAARSSSGNPDDVATVVFTSGSEGRPNGVVVPHRSILARARRARYAADDVVAQKASLTVIAHVSDLLLPLAAGVTVALIDNDTLAHPTRFARELRRQRVTSVMVVPSQLQAMLESDEAVADLQTLRRVVVSGEAVPPRLVESFSERLSGMALIDAYGATETTGLVAVSYLTPHAGPPGWRPSDADVHVVDDTGRPVAAGVAGEIWVGGEQLAHGYLRQPELTAARFVANPFDGSGARLYRTGDMGRRHIDGRLEVLGRVDHEIKVNGFRVNLLDVERAFLAHPAVERAVVVPRGETGRSTLSAYVVPVRGTISPSAAALRHHLRRHIPRHMIPRSIVCLDAVPLLPNGKVDRLGLARRPVAGAAAAGACNGTSATEAQLLGIWCDELGVSAGIRDTFFELGGDSLAAMRILTRIAVSFGVELGADALSEESTVEKLARAIGLHKEFAPCHR